MLNLITKILKYYGIRILPETVKEVLLSHPDYPGMNCISDSFNSWNIKHTVVRITLDRICELGIPAISFFSNGDCIWILKVTEDSIFYKTDSWGTKIQKRVDFQSIWTGISLIIENTDNAQERDYTSKCKRKILEKTYRYSLWSTLFFTTTVFTYYLWIKDNEMTLPTILLVLNNVLGAVVCFFLLNQKYSHNTGFLQKLCKIGSKIDCNEITHSKWSNLFGTESWSSIGFAYFTTIIIWIIFSPVNSEWIIPLWCFFLVTLPFTLASLFIQTFLIRKYCLLCCLTIVLLWNNLWFVDFHNLISIPILESTILFMIFIIFVIISTYANKIRSNECIHLRKELARVKYNVDTINSQLSKTSHAINSLGFTWGNQQAQNEIALYVSLSCIYCNKAIQELSWLIDIYPDFRYRIIIDSESNIDDYNNRFIYQLHYVKNKDAFFNILSNKYDEQTEQFNLSEIGKTNPLTADKLQNINSTIEFCKNIQINYFPAFFINGKLLTNIYDYSDLLGIIRTLS